jgi:hypothetical protein
MLPIMPQDDEDMPPPEELEMAVEEFFGRPMSGNPAERVEAIQKRILYREEQRRCSAQGDEPLRKALLQRIDDDLAEARKQLKEWQSQHEDRN